MNTLKTLAYAVAAWVLLWGGLWFYNQHRWQGTVWPSKTDSSAYFRLGSFDTLEACRHAAHDVLRTVGKEANDYECARICQSYESPNGHRICAEVAR